MIAHLIQLAILTGSGAAIYLLASKEQKHRFIGCLIGAATQPFWLITTFEAGQWGIFLLTLFYIYAYGRGVLNNRSGA